MNDITRCPSHELLVTYLYDECDPVERDSIAAHLALCASCGEDVQGLRDARVHLAAWSPPAMPLGFQLTRTETDQPSKVLTGFASRSSQSEGWWRRPLPAWAQAAAAVVIFAAGMGAGAARSGDAAVENAAAGSNTRAAVTAPVATVSRDDFDRLAARLRSIEAAQKQPIAVSRRASGLDERALLNRVSAMIDARVAQSDLQSISLLASAGRSLESYRAELAGRMDVIEDEIEAQRQDIQQVSRGYQVVRAASLLPAGR